MINSFLHDPLPEKEWKLPHSKGEVDQTTEFYYEYSRSCVFLHDWIIGGRKLWGVPHEPPKNYKLSVPEEEYHKLVRQFPGWKLFGFLGALEDFPSKPFSECRDIGIKFYFFGSHTSPVGLEFYDKSMFDGVLLSDESLNQVSNECFNNPFNGPSGFGSSSLAFMGINWGTSDKELVEEFRRFLRKNRPEEYKKATEQQRRGLGGMVLPFRKSPALKCLGVWRRLKHLAGDWNTFMELYYPKHCRIDCREYGRRDEVLRDSRRSVEVADKILRWISGEKVKF